MEIARKSVLSVVVTPTWTVSIRQQGDEDPKSHKDKQQFFRHHYNMARAKVVDEGVPYV
jgi:hypothetical protein